MANKLLEEVKNFVKKYSLWIALALFLCLVAWAIFDKIGDFGRDSDFEDTIKKLREQNQRVTNAVEDYRRERQDFYRRAGEAVEGAGSDIRDALETVGRIEEKVKLLDD